MENIQSELALVYVSGKMGSGKTTVCEYLNREYRFGMVNCADRIKLIVSVLTGTTPNENYTNKKLMPVGLEKYGSLGTFQQKVGVGLRDAIGENIWIDVLWNEIEKESKKGLRRIIIGDVRFKNEYNFFNDKGAIAIRIERDRELRKPHMGSRDERHISETDLDKEEFEYRYQNEKTKRELYQYVDKIMSSNSIQKVTKK